MHERVCPGLRKSEWTEYVVDRIYKHIHFDMNICVQSIDLYQNEYTHAYMHERLCLGIGKSEWTECMNTYTYILIKNIDVHTYIG